MLATLKGNPMIVPGGSGAPVVPTLLPAHAYISLYMSGAEKRDHPGGGPRIPTQKPAFSYGFEVSGIQKSNVSSRGLSLQKNGFLLSSLLVFYLVFY